MDELTHYLIHFEPPIEISQKIEKLHRKISNQYENPYNSLIDGVWRSHLMVYLSPLPKENEESILDVAEKTSKEFQPFNVLLNDFEKGSTGYIFVGINEESQQPLRNIRKVLIDRILPHRDTTIKQKYLDKWESFTEEEETRIKTTGLPYSYTPHFTAAKVDEDKVKPAMDLISDSSLAGESFTAEYLQVLTFCQDVNQIIGRFKLGS